MAEALAALDGIVVRRRGKAVLGPLSMEISSGQFWGVVGPNGSGKTTLLSTLAGLLPHTQGTAVRFHRPIPRGVLRRAGPDLGLLFQEQEYRHELPLSVLDVVQFGRIGHRDPEPEQTARAVLRNLGLLAFENRLYRELSGGERRLVQLARLAAQAPRLLLLDEPGAGLDLDWQERMTQMVADLHHALGGAVVMVTHEVDRLPACCNQALLLTEGQVLSQGRPEEVFTAARLSALFRCPVVVTPSRGRFFARSAGAVLP